MYLLTCALIPWNTVSDIDECAEGTDDCAQVCTDTDLSYTCSCQSGYRLASDGRGCDGKVFVHTILNAPDIIILKYYYCTCNML